MPYKQFSLVVGLLFWNRNILTLHQCTYHQVHCTAICIKCTESSRCVSAVDSVTAMNLSGSQLAVTSSEAKFISFNIFSNPPKSTSMPAAAAERGSFTLLLLALPSHVQGQAASITQPRASCPALCGSLLSRIQIAPHWIPQQRAACHSYTA